MLRMVSPTPAWLPIAVTDGLRETGSTIPYGDEKFDEMPWTCRDSSQNVQLPYYFTPDIPVFFSIPYDQPRCSTSNMFDENRLCTWAAINKAVPGTSIITLLQGSLLCHITSASHSNPSFSFDGWKSTLPHCPTCLLPAPSPDHLSLKSISQGR